MRRIFVSERAFHPKVLLATAVCWICLIAIPVIAVNQEPYPRPQDLIAARVADFARVELSTYRGHTDLAITMRNGEQWEISDREPNFEQVRAALERPDQGDPVVVYATHHAITLGLDTTVHRGIWQVQQGDHMVVSLAEMIRYEKNDRALIPVAFLIMLAFTGYFTLGLYLSWKELR